MKHAKAGMGREETGQVLCSYYIGAYPNTFHIGPFTLYYHLLIKKWNGLLRHT